MFFVRASDPPGFFWALRALKYVPPPLPPPFTVHLQVEAAAAATAAAASQDVDMETPEEAGGAGDARPDFPALTAREMGGGQDDFRRIRCPPHRLTPLRNSWNNIVTPTVEHMKLQIRRERYFGRHRDGCRIGGWVGGWVGYSYLNRCLFLFLLVLHVF